MKNIYQIFNDYLAVSFVEGFCQSDKVGNFGDLVSKCMDYIVKKNYETSYWYNSKIILNQHNDSILYVTNSHRTIIEITENELFFYKHIPHKVLFSLGEDLNYSIDELDCIASGMEEDEYNTFQENFLKRSKEIIKEYNNIFII